MTNPNDVLTSARETVKTLFPDLPPMTDDEAGRIATELRVLCVESAASWLAVGVEEVAASTCHTCSAPNGTTPGCLSCAVKRRYDRATTKPPPEET